MKSEVRPDGLLGSQSKAAGNSSRASSAMSEEDAIAGYDASQRTWHPSSPRSGSTRSNANRTSNQLPAEHISPEAGFSDAEGAAFTPRKPLEVSGRGHEQDQASVQASESDVHNGLVGSEELEFSEPSEEIDDSKSEESIKSFGDEEYTPSQGLNGPRSESSQKTQRAFTRGAKQKPSRAGNYPSSKGCNHPARGDAEESDTGHPTPVGKAGAARGKGQKAVSQRIAKAASIKPSVNDRPTKQIQHGEQDTRTLPFKRRIAKKPFTPGNEEHASKASLRKTHAKDPASTYSNTNTKGKNIAEIRTHATPQKGVDATTSPALYEIDDSSEHDDKPNPSAGSRRPLKTSDSRANGQDARKSSQHQRAASGSIAANSRDGKSTVKVTQKNPFDDDIIDDDGPLLSLSVSATKPNSKKRRRSPQSYGPLFKKPKGPNIEFPVEDRGGTIAQSSPNDRPDSKPCAPDQNEVPINISSDAPSSDVEEQDLQPDGSDSTDYPAGQQKLQLTTHDSSALNKSVDIPNKKPKTVSTSYYTVGQSPLDQVNAPSNPDNDNLIGLADDDAIRHDLKLSSVGNNAHRAGDNREVLISQQEQMGIRDSMNSTPMKKRSTKLFVSVSKKTASNDPFTGPRDPLKDKGSTNPRPPPQVPGRHITHGSQPQEAATASLKQPHPFTGTNAGVNRWNSLNTQPEASRSKPMPPTYYQRVPQKTQQCYEKPREQHPQPPRDGFSVQHAQARYAQPSPGQEFTAQLNPKTLEFNQKLTAMPSLLCGNPHRQTFVDTSPGKGSSLDDNTTLVGPQLGHRIRQDVHVHGANADRGQTMSHAELYRNRCDDLIYGASEGVAAMLHDIVTVSYTYQPDVTTIDFMFSIGHPSSTLP